MRRVWLFLHRGRGAACKKCLTLFGFFPAVLLLTAPVSVSGELQAAPAEGVETRDTTGDGRVDEWRYSLAAEDGSGEKVLTRIERDQDGDGVPEVRIFFREGKMDRSEVDRNGDGVPDLIRFMKEGRPDREEADLNLDGHPDAWAFYQEGVKDLMIVDKNGDGQPDAWFYYGQGGWKLVAARIDEDYDGQIDRTFGPVPEEETRRPWGSAPTREGE